MRKLLFLCILALLCGCTAKLHVPIHQPITETPPAPVEVTLPETEESTPVEAVQEPVKAPEITTCTFSISCTVLCENLDALDAEKHELVPESGWILPPTAVEIQEGESVFDLLRRLCRENGVLMEFTTSAVYDSAYIEGIANLYEFDAGPQSGWVYSVNGTTPNVGCSSYYPKAGDTVCWEYQIG